MTERYIGRYRVIEKLGEGGMAVVYKCHDSQLDRLVAVKMIHASLSNEKMLKRFEREARALGQLAHPHIVKVLDYGEQEGSPYLVMEFVPGGQTLKELMGKPLPFVEAARLLLPIAQAVAYAHANHIIHRDIKPGNMLIDEAGQPKLADFGIAKFIEAEPTVDLTGTGAAVGTPEYMAPEQILGEEVDERADVYALGIVLYELLTGEKPFDADTPMGLMIQKVEKSVPSPRETLPDLPEGIERLVLVATAKKSWERLGSASVFAEALKDLVEGESTLTVAIRKELQRVKKRKLPLGWLILVGSLVILGLLLAFVLTRNTPVEQARAATQVVVEVLKTATIPATDAIIVPSVMPSPTPTEFATVDLQPTQNLELDETPTQTQPIFRPILSEGNISNIELLHAINQPIYEWPQMSFSPDGTLISVLATHGELQVWKTDPWQMVFNATLPVEKVKENYAGYTTDFLFSPDGALAVYINGNSLEARYTIDWSSVFNIQDQGTIPLSIAISPNGVYLVGLFLPASWNPDAQNEWEVEHIIRLWRLRDGILLHEVKITGDVTFLQFSPDSQLLMLPTNFSKLSSLLRSDYTRDYLKFDTNTLVIRTGDGSLRSILADEFTGTFSSDSRYFAGKYLWDMAGCEGELDTCGRQIGQLRSPGYRYDSQMNFLDENRFFTSYGRIWETQHGKVYFTIEEISGFHDSVLIPDHNQLIISDDYGLVFYDLTRFYTLFTLTNINFGRSNVKEGYQYGSNLSPDGTLLATRQSELLRVRRTTDGEVVYSFDNVPSVKSLSFSPDGRLLIVVNQPTDNIDVISFWGLAAEGK